MSTLYSSELSHVDRCILAPLFEYLSAIASAWKRRI